MAVTQIGIVGAGKEGGCIALVCAFAGMDVILSDGNVEALQQASRIADVYLARLLSRLKVSIDAARAISERIYYSTNESQAVTCKFVIEASNEDFELKQSILERLALHSANDVVIATNVSKPAFIALAETLPDSAKVIGMHLANPVPVMDSVEVIPGRYTSQEAICTALALADRLRSSAASIAGALGRSVK